MPCSDPCLRCHLSGSLQSSYSLAGRLHHFVPTALLHVAYLVIVLVVNAKVNLKHMAQHMEKKRMFYFRHQMCSDCTEQGSMGYITTTHFTGSRHKFVLYLFINSIHTLYPSKHT